MQDHISTDETLVLLTLAGDQNAYESLVVRHQRAVIAAANAVLHSRYLAEDAAQDAFITAWMKLNLLREPDKFGAWVCKIARNCAKNMIVRYRTYLPLDELEGVLSDDAGENPEVRTLIGEEAASLRDTVSRMPERVGEVIRMHYFEELSVSEIAGRLNVSEGTVKWQLHDGRKRIRGELCAMNETMNDTLTRRVMKKVEELKRWQYKNNKNGFEAIYRETLAAVDELPESCDTQEKTKYSAMADVLMRGWWWIPGTKNDALFARIKEAAVRGHNDEVMAFIVSTEDQKRYGANRIDFMKNVQIPMLESEGYPLALAREWFWLGEVYSEENESENAIDALDHALHLSGVDDFWHAFAGASKTMEQTYLDGGYRDKRLKSYRMRGGALEIRQDDGLPRRYQENWYGKGYLSSADIETDFIHRNASWCDGYFTDPALAVGQSRTGSDGTTLTLVDDDAAVTVPAGTFGGCQVWQVCRTEDTVVSYYAPNVGIVRQERYYDGICEVRNLSSYAVRGDGYLPLVTGNTWEYTTEYAPSVMIHTNRVTVSYADDERALLAQTWSLERLSYDENSWLDMISAVRGECWDGDAHVQDVSHYMERAKALAKTPVEIAHTAAACDVAQRIMDTNEDFNPGTQITGHWNFFARNTAKRTEDGQKISFDGNFRWSFELKNIETAAAHQLLFNDMLGILNDDCGCIWSDDWIAGTTHDIRYMRYGTPIHTSLVCEDAGTVTTAAGTFANCIRVCIDTQGLESGLDYRGGKKNYIFAPGIGIVRMENSNAGNGTVVYELVSYEGTGEGYQPLGDGLVRRYEGIDLTDGYISGVEYTYVTDADGTTVIFENRTGIRRKPDRITEYSAIDREQTEDRLWNEGKHDESRAMHATNNILLFLHFLGRPSRYWGAPEQAIAWNKYRLELLEGLNGDGTIPRGWLGLYAATAFRLACALFGCGRNEEGYEWLEKSFAPMEQWLSIPAGEQLELGNPLIWGDSRIVCDEICLYQPDGSTVPLSYDYAYLFGTQRYLFYYGMTAKQGWEWFNGVREEERFKSFIPRAKALTEIK